MRSETPTKRFYYDKIDCLRIIFVFNVFFTFLENYSRNKKKTKTEDNRLTRLLSRRSFRASALS